MKRNWAGIRAFSLHIAAGLLLATASSLCSEPRDPLPPWPEPNPISQLTWNAVLTPMRDDSTAALGVESATLVESWSGYALQRDGVLVAPVVLPGVNAQGQASLGYRQGCVRFWFAPAWTSGAGPGQVARLAEWLVTDGKEVGTLWVLSVSADGTVISLGSQGAEVLKAAINWSAGGWHQVALSYSESGTELVIDGVLVATGTGLLAVEPKISGLVVGSDWQGLLVAGGQFDECLCFAEPMSAEDVAFNYRGLFHEAAKGPVSEEELAEQAALAKLSRDGGGTVAYRWDESNPCPSNGPVFLTNVVCVLETNDTWTTSLDVAGGTNGVVYDVFASTNLAGGTATNGAWWWVTNTYTCSTVVLSNQPVELAFYILGLPQDGDSDGLTDAFEYLVSATGPDDADTDNDGMPDGWEWNHGLNPHDAADASDDSDGDWLTNLQEYTNGSNPRDVMVLAWGGNNLYGELNVPTNLGDVATVEGGMHFSLALRHNGTVASWGVATNILTGLSDVWRLNANWNQAAAVRSNGTVVTWGEISGTLPADLTNAVMATVGDRFALALRSDGTVTAWGTNYNHQCDVPTNLASVRAVAAGWYHSVALLEDGTVAAWGYAGHSTWGITNPPSGLSNVVAVAAGGYHTLALKADGTVEAWGAGKTNTGNGSYLGAEWGQCMIPAGLSNVVAISAGGYHSMALTAAGSVVVWGDLFAFPFADAQGQITAIGSGDLHGLATRSGRLTPLIVLQPTDQFAFPGETVEFTAAGLGLAEVRYQWQFNGVNLTGETNATLTLANVSTNDEGSYRVIVSTGAGSVTSSNAVFQVPVPPVITFQSMPTNATLSYQSNVVFSVTAVAPGQLGPYPISYQWQFNGTNIAGATSSNYNFAVSESGTYSVLVTNVAGGTNASWQVTMTYEGSYVAPGTLCYHMATNAVGRATGYSGSYYDQQIVSGWSYAHYTNENMALLTNSVWSTNCWLKGVQGLSATCIGFSNSLAGQGLITMVSPRHCVFAEHMHKGQQHFIAAFLDTNNVIHWRTNIESAHLGDEVSVGILDSDLPSSVEFLPVVPTNLMNYLPTNATAVVQGIGENQDLRAFSQPMTFQYPNRAYWDERMAIPFGLTTNWSVAIRGGDSSGPERFLIGNQLVLLTLTYGPNAGTNYAFTAPSINQAMHYLSTNNNAGSDYQITSFSLTNWPTIR
jgi:alpha-tubulin suppressor-like RCC1 family protein